MEALIQGHILYGLGFRAWGLGFGVDETLTGPSRAQIPKP